jgi:hypothetical protein
MHKIFLVFLIGCLSMLFAEVFSGASQAWFFNGWGILVTFPLYLAHLLFFLWIALKLKKTSLPQLYFFGIIFALYESWITKVIWMGYIDAGSPALGTLLGLGISEFPILTFFWHPIMSFIIPILTFEILTKKADSQHIWLLKKSTWKTSLIVIFLILIATFIVNGNQFSLLSANISLIGSLLLIFIFYFFSKKFNLKDFAFKRGWFITITIYLGILYLVTFFLLLPERIPPSILPYVSLLFFYILAIWLITKLKLKATRLVSLNRNHYSIKDLVIFALITILSVNFMGMIPQLSYALLGISYYLFWLVGVILFLTITYKIIFKKSF